MGTGDGMLYVGLVIVVGMLVRGLLVGRDGDGIPNAGGKVLLPVLPPQTSPVARHVQVVVVVALLLVAGVVKS